MTDLAKAFLKEDWAAKPLAFASNALALASNVQVGGPKRAPVLRRSRPSSYKVARLYEVAI